MDRELAKQTIKDNKLNNIVNSVVNRYGSSTFAESHGMYGFGHNNGMLLSDVQELESELKKLGYTITYGEHKHTTITENFFGKNQKVETIYKSVKVSI